MRTVAILLCLLLSACGYHLGSGVQQKPFASIYVAPAKNRALAPQMQGLISTQLSQALISDGTYVVTDKALADVVLETTLTHYKHKVATSEKNDSSLASTFDLTLDATFSIYDQRAQKYLLENQKVSSSVHVIADNSMQGSEYQSTSELTRDLAVKIKERVTNIW
ncbi:MAG: hypothetical protein A2Y14_05350 [Verrucomicrobia bacterium GWF2_51_19]|nr:MAG: hypothetical protein A2Y14_05350 [Verrucomicrobia bacterium GWF2_51_19]HCJ12323.1 hypothetical protein [Opitutae bacterium]